jgi:hypothetical protein
MALLEELLGEGGSIGVIPGGNSLMTKSCPPRSTPWFWPPSREGMDPTLQVTIGRILDLRYAKDWPGAHTLPPHVGTRVIRVKRPPHYFDPNNPEWPEELELRLEMPVALDLDYGPELARQRIAERVRDKQHQAWNKAKRTGLSFVGARRVLKLAHTKRAKTYEVFGSLNPQFAAAGNRAAATEAVKRLRAFKVQYARALGAWTAGDRSACFPEGTWWMRVCHGARCGPAP